MIEDLINTYRLSSEQAICENSSGAKLMKWPMGDRFIKTSTYTGGLHGLEFNCESYAEVIVSKLARRMGFNCINYSLCRVIIDDSIDTVACESRDFRFDGYDYISIKDLIDSKIIEDIQSGDYVKLLNALSNVVGFKEYIDQLVFLDSLMLNTDRHYGNFGVLINKSGDIKTAPIFNNGSSLMCNRPLNSFNYSDELVEYIKCKPFSTSFNEQLSLINGVYMELEWLPKSTDTLVRHMVKSYDLPYERGKVIKDIIHSRVNYYNSVMKK